MTESEFLLKLIEMTDDDKISWEGVSPFRYKIGSTRDRENLMYVSGCYAHKIDEDTTAVLLGHRPESNNYTLHLFDGPINCGRIINPKLLQKLFMSVRAYCRKHGTTDGILARWKRKLGLDN